MLLNCRSSGGGTSLLAQVFDGDLDQFRNQNTADPTHLVEVLRDILGRFFFFSPCSANESYVGVSDFSLNRKFEGGAGRVCHKGLALCLLDPKILTGTLVICSCVTGSHQNAQTRNASSVFANTNQTLGDEVGAADAQSK